MKILVEFDFPKDLNDHISDDFIFGNIQNSIPFTNVSHKVVRRIYSSTATFDSIEKSVCDFTNLKPIQIQSKTRKREIIEARQICHYLSKKNDLGSLALIGYRFGNKDHATVLHSIGVVTTLLNTDATFKIKYESFIETFNHGNSKLAENNNDL